MDSSLEDVWYLKYKKSIGVGAILFVVVGILGFIYRDKIPFVSVLQKMVSTQTASTTLTFPDISLQEEKRIEFKTPVELQKFLKSSSTQAQMLQEYMKSNDPNALKMREYVQKN